MYASVQACELLLQICLRHNLRVFCTKSFALLQYGTLTDSEGGFSEAARQLKIEQNAFLRDFCMKSYCTP